MITYPAFTYAAAALLAALWIHFATRGAMIIRRRLRITSRDAVMIPVIVLTVGLLWGQYALMQSTDAALSQPVVAASIFGLAIGRFVPLRPDARFGSSLSGDAADSGSGDDGYDGDDGDGNCDAG